MLVKSILGDVWTLPSSEDRNQLNAARLCIVFFAIECVNEQHVVEFGLS